MVGTEQSSELEIPLVQILCSSQLGSPCFGDALQAGVPFHVEGFFAQHVRHGAAQRREGRILEHLQLELAVAIDEVGVGEEVEQLSTSSLKEQAGADSNARRSSIFCASIFPEWPKCSPAAHICHPWRISSIITR